LRWSVQPAETKSKNPRMQIANRLVGSDFVSPPGCLGADGHETAIASAMNAGLSDAIVFLENDFLSILFAYSDGFLAHMRVRGEMPLKEDECKRSFVQTLS
jgi:hypothetical protein